MTDRTNSTWMVTRYRDGELPLVVMRPVDEATARKVAAENNSDALRPTDDAWYYAEQRPGEHWRK